MARDRPTMNDVAADAGVSLKTVSRVINGVVTVDAALARRVVESSERLGFRRNLLAANLRAGRSSTIGLITADLSNAFYTTIADAVSTVAIAHGHQVIMASAEEDPERERTLVLDLCQRQVGGLIIVPAGGGDQAYLSAEALGTPVVFLDRPGEGVDSVLLDNRGGARSGVEALLASGHRRIALLFDSLSIFTMSERLAGVAEAYRAVGAEPDPGLLSTTAHSPARARAELERLLDSTDPPSAVFCANNRATIGAAEALVARGIELDLVGFDDFETSRLLPFAVTIVEYDALGLGTLAAEILFGRMAGEDSPPAHRLVATRLNRRGGIIALRNQRVAAD